MLTPPKHHLYSEKINSIRCTKDLSSFPYYYLLVQIYGIKFYEIVGKNMFICVYMLLLFQPNTQKQHLTLILNSQKSEKKDLPTLCLLLLSAKIFHCRPLFCCFSIMLSSRIFLTPKMKFMQSHRIDFVIDLLNLFLL